MYRYLDNSINSSGFFQGLWSACFRRSRPAAMRSANAPSSSWTWRSRPTAPIFSIRKQKQFSSNKSRPSSKWVKINLIICGKLFVGVLSSITGSCQSLNNRHHNCHFRVQSRCFKGLPQARGSQTGVFKLCQIYPLPCASMNVCNAMFPK